MMAFLLSFVGFALVMAGMAIGVIFGKKAIKGSCGGINGEGCGCVAQCLKKRMKETN